jgi:hypothetical protein
MTVFAIILAYNSFHSNVSIIHRTSIAGYRVSVLAK